MVARMSSRVSRLRSEAAVYSGGTAADTYVSVVRWQQGEQTGAGWVLSFSVFRLCADISLQRYPGG